MKEIRVAVIGAGELGVQAVHYMKLMSKENEKFIPIGWIDDTYAKGVIKEGFPVIGKINEINTLFENNEFDACFIAIGYNYLKYKSQLIQKLKHQIPMINIISPKSYVDQTVSLGVNIFIYPGVIIDKGVKLHDGCLLNLGSIVSHDSEIGKSSFLAPNVAIAGFCKIGSFSFLGLGSRIIDNINICNRVKIGAGSVVTRDIDISGTYFGVPATYRHS